MNDETLKAKLRSLCAPEPTPVGRLPLDKIMRLEDHAVASNGKSLLVVTGRADLSDDVPAPLAVESAAGLCLAATTQPVMWPDLAIPEEPAPPEKCPTCNGMETECEECDGSGHCRSCHDGTCSECDGTGKGGECSDCHGHYDPKRGLPSMHAVEFVMPTRGRAVLDARRLAEELAGLPKPTRAAVVSVGAGKGLMLRGEGYHYLLCGMNVACPKGTISLEAPRA